MQLAVNRASRNLTWTKLSIMKGGKTTEVDYPFRSGTLLFACHLCTDCTIRQTYEPILTFCRCVVILYTLCFLDVLMLIVQ